MELWNSLPQGEEMAGDRNVDPEGCHPGSRQAAFGRISCFLSSSRAGNPPDPSARPTKEAAAAGTYGVMVPSLCPLSAREKEKG
ncbi:Hypothetical predicted protein [Podarcis lilfordi]|uniref:Uncharacterized protein n=1 Tax=Podarcis lilfordi TaxID=74358 RepID=A0AA35PHT4_9SAUR|nr:Hypothetical predicted protein [Podarcis lilfordi]